MACFANGYSVRRLGNRVRITKARGEIPSICVISVVSAHSGKFDVRKRKTASIPGEAKVQILHYAPKPKESAISLQSHEERKRRERRGGCENFGGLMSSVKRL